MAEPKPFRPSPRQRRLAEAACSLTFNIHPHLVCAQAQIPPSTYYRWQKNPAFTAWLAATILQCLAANSPFLLLNTLQAAMSGDASARKLIFQFCVVPRLAPAMAALPAPGLEVFLGIPAVPGSEGAPACPPPVPRPSSPPSAPGVAVPAVRTHKTITPPRPIPPRGEDAAPIPGAPRQRRGNPAEGGANRNPVPPAAPAAGTEPPRGNTPLAAEPGPPPFNEQPPSGAETPICPHHPRSPHRRAPAAKPPRPKTPPFPPGIAPMWRVNKEGKLQPRPRSPSSTRTTTTPGGSARRSRALP